MFSRPVNKWPTTITVSTGDFGGKTLEGWLSQNPMFVQVLQNVLRRVSAETRISTATRILYSIAHRPCPGVLGDFRGHSHACGCSCSCSLRSCRFEHTGNDTASSSSEINCPISLGISFSKVERICSRSGIGSYGYGPSGNSAKGNPDPKEDKISGAIRITRAKVSLEHKIFRGLDFEGLLTINDFHQVHCHA